MKQTLKTITTCVVFATTLAYALKKMQVKLFSIPFTLKDFKAHNCDTAFSLNNNTELSFCNNTAYAEKEAAINDTQEGEER